MLRKIILLTIVLLCGIGIGIFIGSKLWYTSNERIYFQTINDRLAYLSLLNNSQVEACISDMEQELEWNIKYSFDTGIQIPDDPSQQKDLAYMLSLSRAYFESKAENRKRSKTIERLQSIPLPKSLDVSNIVGSSLPNIQMQTLNSETIDLSTLKKLVLLDFWASWCGNCWKTSHVLDEVKLWADEQHIPVTILSVNYGEDKEKARQSQIKMNIKGPVCLDKELVLAKSCNVNSLPTFIVADRGKIVAAKIGTLDNIKDWFIAQIRQNFSAELNQKQ